MGRRASGIYAALAFTLALILCGCGRDLPDIGPSISPVIENLTVTDISPTGAILIAYVSGVTQVENCWFSVREEGTGLSTDYPAKSDGGIFTATLSGLKEACEYSFSAHIGNGAGLEIESEIKRFSTTRKETPPPDDPEDPDEPDDSVTIPDPVFREWLLWFFDTDKDGQLDREEADAVYEIEFNSVKVRGIEGIRYFPNLWHLHACGEGDENRGSLTEVDLTANHALRNVCLIYNHISVLKMADLPDLDRLDLDYNDLGIIDVKEFTSITLLQLSYNKLSRLDVSGMDSLNELHCDGNPLKELTLGNKALEYINCSGTGITSLDISLCPRLNILDCSDCTSLETIWMAKGQVVGNMRKPDSVNIKYYE